MLVLVGAAGAVSACGHLPFDDLPVIEDGLSGPDGSPDGDGSSRDGAVLADGSISNDGDITRDGGDDDAALDGGLTDATRIDGSTCVECDILHVSTAVGDDKNDGSVEHPLKTIQASVDKASGGQEIHVAGGTYLETVTIAKKLVLKGGYRCDALTCDWTKSPDAASNPTIVTSKTSFAGTLVFKPGTKNSTAVSGLHVIGRSGALDNNVTGPGGIAVGIYGGTPILSDLVIDGGTITSGTAATTSRRSIGLYIEGSNIDEQVTVKRTTINGGTSETASVGVWLDSPTAGGALPAQVVVKDCTISAAQATSSFGVVARASGKETLFEHNVITSKVSTLSNEGASWGVVLESAGRFYRNKINFGPDLAGAGLYCNNTQANPCGGVFTTNASLDFESNFIGGVPAPTSIALFITATDGHATDGIVNGNFLRGGAGTGPVLGNSVSAAIGLRLSATATAHTTGAVRNNILEGQAAQTRFGVFEITDASAKGHIKALSYNDFWNVDYVYAGWDGTNATKYKYSDIDTLPTVEHLKNINLDPLLTTDGHLMNGSPCINAGLENDEILSTDIDGDSRPVGTNVDIGPDERGD